MLPSPLPISMLPPVGVYIHIPFCHSKCFYCDFASGIYPASLVRDYLAALRLEIQTVGGRLSQHLGILDAASLLRVETLYLGGGTPSSIPAQEIVALINLLRQTCHFGESPEITVEVNPESLTAEKVEAYLSAGVNRLSVGVQSFQDPLLERIGRRHHAAGAIEVIKMIRACGVRNLSLDLIAGLPGQSLNSWRKDLSQVVALEPEHISIYLLEIHEDSGLGKIYGAGHSSCHDAPQAELPGEDKVEAMYLETLETLPRHGFNQYEISNFARPGKQSRHNQKYWKRQPVLGLGSAAHSHLFNKRWANQREPENYVKSMKASGQAIAETTVLRPQEVIEEAIYLGLRLTEGLQFRQFARQYGVDLRAQYARPLDHLREAGLIEISGETLCLTAKGCLLSNEVFTELL